MYSMEVMVNGKSVKQYRHNGNVYVEGRRGTEYTIRLHNRGWQRVLAVVSVDGLSVMDGEPAGAGNGYIVPARSSIDVPGWRLDDASVARFAFGETAEAYATKQQKQQNMGVIGCLFFEEETVGSYVKTDPWYPYQGPKWNSTGCLRGMTYSTDTVSADPVKMSMTGDGVAAGCSTACCDAPQPETANLGTVFGRQDSHHVQEVSFWPKERPHTESAIYYDDRAGLEARGIRFDVKAEVADPFPARRRGCEPPADWTGK